MEDGFALMSGTTGARGRPAIAAIYKSAGGELKLRAIGYSPTATPATSSARTATAPETRYRKVRAGAAEGRRKWLIAADIDTEIAGNRR
jgi:hypothetical protein